MPASIFSAATGATDATVYPHMTLPVAQAPVSHEWVPDWSPQEGAPAPAAPTRGSAKGEDKDSLTFGSRTAVRRLAR